MPLLSSLRSRFWCSSLPASSVLDLVEWLRSQWMCRSSQLFSSGSLLSRLPFRPACPLIQWKVIEVETMGSIIFVLAVAGQCVCLFAIAS